MRKHPMANGKYKSQMKFYNKFDIFKKFKVWTYYFLRRFYLAESVI